MSVRRCALFRTPWSVRTVARRDEAAWFAQNIQRRRLALSKLERDLLFAGEHPLRLAFSLLALQIALLVLAAVLPQDWFTPAWFNWAAAEQLTHFSTVWTIQATLAALVYPIVISFVAVYLQRRPAAEAFIHLYMLDSGGLAAGLSSLGLVVVMGVQYLMLSTWGTAWLPGWAAIDTAWFVLNAALTTLFLFRTVEFLRPEVQARVIQRYTVNVALPRDVQRLNSFQVLAGGIAKGWFPVPSYGDDKAPEGPRLLIGRGFREGDIQGELRLRAQARLVDVRIWVVRLVVESWYPSQSEADLALIKLLLPHADSPRECWLTFRLSKLGERDKARRSDYARATLSLAAQHLTNDAVQAQHGQQIAESLFQKEREQHLNPRHFRLLSDSDLQRLPTQRWLVKGIIPEGSVGTVFGQSGTFKSFLVLDLMAHIANGQPWFGYRVKAAPAVYVPFEGQGGIPKRVAAWRMARMRNGCSISTNIRFITDRMNLRLQADRDKLVQTLSECGWAGGMLCIDTLAQAGAGIDENSSEGMGEMIAIFQELQHRLGGTVLVVHHSGKVESAGMRGWSGLRGALDFAIKCWRDDKWDALDAQFVLDKVKDGESGNGLNFSMLRVHIGMDEEGDEISSLTVVPPQEREQAQAPDEAALAAADDEFVDGWVRKLMAGGQRPTGRGLEGMRAEVKSEHNLTQKRLRDAIARLKDRGRLSEETGGRSGAKWLRAVDTPPPQL